MSLWNVLGKTKSKKRVKEKQEKSKGIIFSKGRKEVLREKENQKKKKRKKES